MNKIETEINRVKKRLAELQKKIKTINFLKGLFLLVVILSILFITLPSLELLGVNSTSERKTLFFLGLGVFLFSLLYLIVPNVISLIRPVKLKSYQKLALLVGNKFKEIGDKLLNTFQLYEDKNQSDLAKAAIISQLKQTEGLDFKSLVSFGELKKTMILLMISVVAVVGLFFIFPAFGESSSRIINYSQTYIIPTKYKFIITPQNTTVTKGERVFVKVKVLGGEPSTVSLFTKDRESKSYIEHKLIADTTKIYQYVINSISNTTKYFVLAEDVKSDEFTIKVIDKPIISELKIKITPPGYTKLESTVQKDNGNITALIGSKIELSIKASKELGKGIINFNDSTEKKMVVNKNIGSGRFKIIKNVNYKIIITDTSNNKNDRPIEYKIKSKADLFPTIEIIEPTEDIALTKTEAVYSRIKIKDDFGFRTLVLKHKLTATSFGEVEKEFSTQIIPIKKSVTNQELFYLWNVSKLMLTAGDIVSFYFEVFDNDFISGPKSVKSKMLQLRVPTMDEVFNETEATQEKVEVDLEKVLEEAEKLKEKMKNLGNELKKDEKDITWDEKKKIEDVAEQFKQLKEKIKEAQKRIDEAKQNLDENNLLSKETLQKYNELQKLMDEMNSENMKKAMEKLQKQMKNMNRDRAQQSLDNMKFDEEMLKKSIERTVKLLKRIQIEQKMDEVIKRAEELKKEADELKKETEKSDLADKKEKNNLAKKNNDISKQLEKLKKEMKKLKDKMGEFKEMPNDKMSDLQKKMEDQQNQNLSKKMQKMLEQSNKTDAMQQMQQLSQNMKEMGSEMQQMQQQMQQQNQMKVMFEMMKGINNLLSLSKEEEALKNSLSNKSAGQQQRLDNLQKQKEISDGLDKTLKGLSELSQKTFAITPEMGKALGNAKRDMNNAMQQMQSGNNQMAMLGQRGAMKYLNEAASMMKGNMEQMMNGGGKGGGMMSMMQQMQQMAQQQMQLNQLTQQMMNGGKLTPQQQAALQRLSQQQDLIKKSLEQLNKESKERGESKTLTSNLEKILEEMQEVISGMNTKKIDDDLIQTQSKILSKLLDAQRSINERDFEKNRESQSSKNFNRKSPKKLNLTPEKNNLKDELIKLINEGYSKDYEEIIKRYYEMLDVESETK